MACDQPRMILLERQLPREPAAGRLARHELARRLVDCELDGSVEDASTIVAELVNNAYLHGSGGIRLRVVKLGSRLRIEVCDEGDGEAARGPLADRYGPGGFGLGLVRALALDCGREPGSANIWAELDCTQRQANADRRRGDHRARPGRGKRR
jgi:anti-sigma regulatory factor (Ser/Thr protein kinase)